ncbi:MAG: hypothetical protein ACI4F4_08710 [Lachnospiraceae bacterium]
MNILGIILIITGMGLFFAGRLTKKSLPPDYDAVADDGFYELLCSVGRVLEIAGCIFVVIGILCVFICALL